MEKKNGKFIEVIILIAGILLTAAVVVAIPLASYYNYADYLEKLIELSKPEPKPVLESLSVSLKEGVQYFDNDLAEPHAEDLLVVANYTLDGEPYTEELSSGQFSMTFKNDFYAVGGEIKVTYKNQTGTLLVNLIPVSLEKLSITQTPYNIKYQKGTTFNTEGLIISAVYNDGSTKIIEPYKYVISNTGALSTSDTAVSISYSEGGATQTVTIPVSVVDVLDNGEVTSLALAGDAIVQAGDLLSETVMTIDAVYASGNRRPLDPSEYYVSGGDIVTRFGRAYNVSVYYAENTRVSLTTGVIVRATMQAEDGVIVGGSRDTETEYAIVNGVIAELSNKVSFAGGFGKSVLNGNEGSLTLTVTSDSDIVGSITMRCGNSYCCFANGSNKNGGYRMLPLKVNTILDLTVNGRDVEIPDNVVLKGTDVNKDFAPLYGIYYEFTFENIALEPGVNTIKVKFKTSTAGAMNCFNESPSTMNIDYVNFDTVGNEIPESFVIENIEISPNYTVEVGCKISDIRPPVIQTFENGTRVFIPSSYFRYEVSGGEEGETRTKYGKYTVKASLISDPRVSATTDIEFVGIKVLHAGLEQEGDKVYYVFSGESYGYTKDDLIFFDESKMYDLITEFTDKTFTFKIDVTNLTPGTVVYPHLRVRGIVYQNGANNAGDIRDNGLTFNDYESVTYNGQIYQIRSEYSMPTLRVFAEE